jgi:FkbM family methyltransferase
MNLSSVLSKLSQASSDWPTLFKKVSNPSMFSFMLCRNLRLLSRDVQFEKIIDVGANEGQFASMARFCWPGAQIDCFEPDPLAFQKLKSNHGDDNRVSFYPFAVGDREQYLDLYINENSVQNSLLVEKRHRVDETTSVQVKTLDMLYSKPDLEKRSLLKIDVQGYELKVLQGFCKQIGQVSHVLVEISLMDVFEGGCSLDEVWSLLRELGFSYSRVIDQYYDPELCVVTQMDFLFERL